MFFIPLILTAGLDLSLPEFQPQTDLSGNVIVGSFDKEDPVDVMPLEDISINDLLNDVSDNDKKTTVSNGDISSNEKVKDSGGNSAGSGAKSEPVRSVPSAPDGYHYETLTSSSLNGIGISGTLPYTLVTNTSSITPYIKLDAGVTYYITTSFQGVFFGSDITLGTTLTYSSGSSQTYTPSADCYVFSRSTTTLSAQYLAPDSPSGDITGNDYTAVVEALGIINDNILDINDKLDDLSSAGADDSEVLDRHTQLFRAMLLCLLITFLYPIALSIVRNIVGGDSNV